MRARILPYKGPIPLLLSSLLIILCLAGCAQDSNILDNGQSRQLEFSVSTHGWSNSNSFSNYKKDSRATPISGNTFDTSNSFNVIADINKGSNWTTEVKNETVSYSTANNIWQTSATHYWPGFGSTVNFYAYYPTSISGSITHSAGSAPVLSYTVPDHTTDQMDILASSKTGVAGDSYNQTPVDFKHILAAVNFQVGTNGMPSGTITGVTLNNIQYKGTYSLDGTWTPNTTDKKFFSQAVYVPTSTGTVITSGTMTFMMIPQTLDNASITVTYSNAGTLTKVITGTWEAGKTYTYNLSKTIPVANFDYIGDVQSYTVPLTGTYKIECWGAEGADCDIGNGGNGGYTKGEISLKKGTILYLCVGQSPSKNSLTGGWNGGGIGTTHADVNGLQTGYSGGGATDIRPVYSKNCLDFSSLKSRIMVAAGGSGAGSNGAIAGAGGGINGNDGNDVTQNGNLAFTASGGTQTSGGDTKNTFEYVDGDSIKGLLINSGLNKGGFGYGGTNNGYKAVLGGCAGGAGYYGGGASNRGHGGGGGGSSFISGYPGCNAISESSTSTNIIHTGSPDHYSGYVFTNMEMIAGDSSMPAPSGGKEIGHSGNGYARITFVSAN